MIWGDRSVGRLGIAGAVLVGCNIVTGADGIEFDGVGGRATTSQAASGTSAASNATTTGSVSGAGGGQTGSVGSGSGAPSSSTIAASSSTGPEPCVYPAGPYGVTNSKTLPQNLKWQGYPAGGMGQGALAISELYDCDGSKGIHALMFITAQYG